MITYFQTVATVIPVLLVAGMLNPGLLRDYSRSSRRSRMMKGQLIFALAGTFVAVSMSAGPEFSHPDGGSWWEWTIYLVVLVFASGSLGSTLLFVYYVAKFALDENPHPDRLKSEKQELKRSLAMIERRMRESGAEETGPGA